MFYAMYTSGGASESALVAMNFDDWSKTMSWPSRTSPISNACGYNATLNTPSATTNSTISSVNGGTYKYAYGTTSTSTHTLTIANSGTATVSAGGTILSWLAKTYNTAIVVELG